MGKIKILLGIGILSLVIGGFLTFSSKNRSQDNLDIAMNATNAQEAAEMISKNNRSEVGGHMLGMFLTGLGGALSVFSAIGIVIEKKKEK